MSKKIFKSILFVALCVFFASLIFIFGIIYTYFSDICKSNLRAQTSLAACAVETNGIEFLYKIKDDNYRFTLIDSDGSVLYDTSADNKEMENHLEREEIREAIAEGIGESSRYSKTLYDKQFYCAKKLDDGTILRLSVSQTSVWVLILSFAQPIAMVVAIALILSFILAKKLSLIIVKPINEIKPDSPEEYKSNEELKEIVPLLDKMIEQQEQIKRDKAEIEKSAMIRQEFTANVSHELKTPLHVISGYAELIENGMAEEKDIKPFAGKIRTESARLGLLVEDIINLTALDSGSEDSPRENTDLYRIVENAIDSLSTESEKKNITVSLSGSQAVVNGIPSVLYSIVYNLCDNAIKYNDANGSVKVDISKSEGNVILSVTDTGIGIPDEDIDRIFERFYRVNKSRSKEAGGTGLGLSIVKHGVLIHNGKIDVKSEKGKGSEFIITIPESAVL